MSDPVNPDGSNRRTVDENVVHKRSTDPRLRTGALGTPGHSEPRPTAPPAPPPLSVTPSPPPALLGLPGQAAPDVPDFDAPTIAVPAEDMAALQGGRVPHHLRVEADDFRTVQSTRPDPLPTIATTPPPPASLRVDTAFVGFEGGPATSVDVAPAMPARPRGSTLPGMALDDIESGSARRPVRERVRSASGPIAVPQGEPVEVTNSGRTRPATNVSALDPPVEVTNSGRTRPATNVSALDPPVEVTNSGRTRPATNVSALDPPVEVTNSGRTRPATRVSALDPAVEASSSGRVRPSSTPPVEASSGGRARPPDNGPAHTEGRRPGSVGLVVGAVVAIAAVALTMVAGETAGTSRRYSADDERRLADLWLAHGTAPWGGVRTDGVVRAVEQVGATMVKALDGAAGAHSPRFVVLKDEVTVQTFALPDGSIAVTTAALRRLGNEAQLAALLAHGLAHVALGDVSAVLDRQADIEPAVRQALGGGAPKAAVDLVSTAATVPQTPVRELEADRLTIEALADAGYAPTALADVIRNFGVRGGGRRAAWLGTHPDDPARMGSADDAGGGGRTNETEYANRVLDIIGRLTPTGARPDASVTTPEKGGGATTPTTPPAATPTPPPAAATATTPTPTPPATSP